MLQGNLGSVFCSLKEASLKSEFDSDSKVKPNQQIPQFETCVLIDSLKTPLQQYF